MTTSKTEAAAAATAKLPFSVPICFAEALLPLLFSKDLMRVKGNLLRDVEAGTRSLIQYLALQATRGGRRSGRDDETEAG